MRLSHELRRLWRLLSLYGSLVAALAIPALACADAYPTRPIDFIVPWGTGGGADFVGRALAKEMQPILGVSLPVLNVPGGTGQTGLIKMRDSKADGYTIEEVTSETVLLEVTGRPLFKLSDFVCLGVVDQQDPGLLVRMDSPFKTWQDVANAAKSGRVSVAFDGYGSSGDLIVNYLNRKLGTKFELVPYDKPGERIASVLGGHNDLLFTQPGDVLTYINGKQLRPILMFADDKSAAFPEVPVSRQFGLTASLIHFRAMYVKAGSPPEIVSRLTDAVNRAALSPGYKSALQNEAALSNSVVPTEKATAFIQSWLGEAKRIKEAK
jgi:putative tricarboxylic transport membrane protein